MKKETLHIGVGEREREETEESLDDLLNDDAFAVALINALNRNFVLEVEAMLEARRAH